MYCIFGRNLLERDARIAVRPDVESLQMQKQQIPLSEYWQVFQRQDGHYFRELKNQTYGLVRCYLVVYDAQRRFVIVRIEP